MKFNKLAVNHHNVYNTNTGEFTVPVNGLYAVGCVIQSIDYSSVHNSIAKNGNAFILGFYFGGRVPSNTQNALMYLSKGDRITIKHRTGLVEHVLG